MNEAVKIAISKVDEVEDMKEDDSFEKMMEGIIKSANEIAIVDDESNEAAGGVLKQIKYLEKQVKNYWDPIVSSAYSEYKDLNAKKKAALDPLEGAEKSLKTKVANYTMEKERKRAEEERKMREAARREMERKLEEAAAAESKGDAVAAEFAMSEAEVLEGASMTAVVQDTSKKVSGVSHTKTWKITKIDRDKVPVSFANVEIRPVDEGAIMRLIKETKGTVKIPGVTYEETVNVSVRV